MRSPRGFASAVIFLLALPAAFVYQMVAGAGVEVVIHLALALGSALMSVAVFDFRTAKWIAWVGSLSAGALAVIFALQGVSEMAGSASFTHLVYQVLGQRAEAWLADVFLAWCVAMLLLDSHGKTRVLGMLAMAIAVSIEVYANGLLFSGTSLTEQAPSLRVLSLLPFAWLLCESRKAYLSV
jgi:hypothetical protein